VSLFLRLEFVRYKQQAILIRKGQTGRVNDSRMTGAAHHVDQVTPAGVAALKEPVRTGSRRRIIPLACKAGLAVKRRN
jgi:hypothetical protein